ncbi:MAG: putative DNA-binding domain-containing protein [Vicinamibacterales bacterium]
MPTLLEFQRAMREALVTGRPDAMTPHLAGGDARRLAIHVRHYRASLTRAIVDRFPATAWLIGSRPVFEAAEAFVHEHPPARPCLAEYGEAFPEFLAALPDAGHLGYLAEFATLEWHAGRLALATEDSPSMHFMHVSWPVDELLALYLTDTAPDRFEMAPCDAWVEIGGCRGELTLRRVAEPAGV